MPFDFQNFTVRPLVGQTALTPKFSFELRVVNTGTNTTVRDFTGANAIIFPDALAAFTAAEKMEMAETIAAKMIEIKRRAFE